MTEATTMQASAGSRASDLRDDSVPRIGRGFRLQWEAAQDAHVLLYPEGMVKLNQSAGEILARCDGKADLAAIVAALERAFGASGLRGDIERFLELARSKHWVEWDAESPKAGP